MTIAPTFDSFALPLSSDMDKAQFRAWANAVETAVNSGASVFDANGTLAINPTAASVYRGIDINQTGPNSGTSGTGIKFNRIAINSDASSVTTTNYGLAVEYGFGGSNMQGQRVALRGLAVLNNASNAANPADFAYAGVSGEMQFSAGDAGTNLTTGAKGTGLGLYGSVIAVAGATNLNRIVGAEVNTSSRTGSSSRYHFGFQITQWYDHAVSGASLDAGLYFGNQLGAIGWKNHGIVFDNTIAGVGTIFQATATIIGTLGAFTVTNGIDFSSATITGSILKAAALNLTSTNFLFGTQTAYAVTSEGAAAFTPALQIHSAGAGATMSITRWSANANQGRFVMAKSRGAAIGTRGAVQSGDVLGTILFNGDDGTNFIPGAGITARVNGTPGTNDLPTDLIFSTTPDGAAAPNEWMVLRSNGLLVSGGGIQFLNATSIPAGGLLDTGLLMSSVAHFGVFFGSGVPTLQAAKGSLYLRSDGTSTSTRMYVNTDGNTTWTNLVTAA